MEILSCCPALIFISAEEASLHANQTLRHCLIRGASPQSSHVPPAWCWMLIVDYYKGLSWLTLWGDSAGDGWVELCSDLIDSAFSGWFLEDERGVLWSRYSKGKCCCRPNTFVWLSEIAFVQVVADCVEPQENACGFICCRILDIHFTHAHTLYCFLPEAPFQSQSLMDVELSTSVFQRSAWNPMRHGRNQYSILLLCSEITADSA